MQDFNEAMNPSGYMQNGLNKEESVDFSKLDDAAFEQHLFTTGMGEDGLDFENMSPAEKERLALYLRTDAEKPRQPSPFETSGIGMANQMGQSAAQVRDMSQPSKIGMGSLMKMALMGK